MSTIAITRTYSHSPSEVFATLNDFAGIHRFHPLLKSSPLVAGTPATGAGSERVCHLNDGNTPHERLVDAELDKLVLGRKLKGNLELLLDALGEHLRTGEDIPADWKAS